MQGAMSDEFLSFLSPYQIDHLQFMQTQESSYRISVDYLFSPFATVTAADRRILCSWSYQTIDAISSIKITREIACIGMSYLDRFMATSSARAKVALSSRDEYQLATASCMVIALKNRGGVILGMDFVADEMCHGLYTLDELVDMEMDVLQALSWKLNGPSPHEFIDAIVGLLPASSFDGGPDASSLRLLSKLSKIHVEAAVLEYTLALQSSSNLAYAAILTSLQTTSVLDGFHHTEFINWISIIKSVMAGSRADQIFAKGLADTVQTTWSNYSGNDDDDEDEDDNEDETSIVINSMHSSDCIANIHDQLKRRNSVKF